LFRLEVAVPHFLICYPNPVPTLFVFASFTAEDAKDLSALCSHISVALENIKRADEAEEVCMLRACRTFILCTP